MFGFNNKIWKLLAVIIAVIYCLVESGGEGDFFIFVRAAGDLGHDRDIYAMDYMGGFHYYYSVAFALFLKPLYYLPFFWVKFCWLLLNLGLYLHLFLLLSKSEFVSALNEKQKKTFLFLVFLFSFRFSHQNLHVSQITILILWCCIYGLHFIRNNKPLPGAVLLAIGINIKLLPIVFLPYLLYRGYFKAFAITILFYALSLVLPSFIIGHTYNMALLESWFNLVNPTMQRHVLDVDERSFHGLSTLLSTLLVKDVPDTYAMHIKRNILDVSLEALSLALLIIRLSLATFTLYFLKWPPFKIASSGWKQALEIAYLLLLIPLIFPHQQHYAFLFIVPSFAAILYYFILNFEAMPRSFRQIIISSLVLIYLCSNLSVLLGEFNQYYEHFKLLTYGALLLIPLLVLVSGRTGLSAKDF
jgi:hypothetical protein